MMEKLTLSDFIPLLNEPFTVAIDDSHAVEMTLTHATSLAFTDSDREHSQSAREPFSLIFLGPREVRLPQRIYSFRHAALGPLDVFVVPVAEDASGRQYEAIFY